MIVLAIAAAVLILILTSVGVMMRDSNRDTTWPPTQSSCPDGWEPDITTPGKCYMPSGMKNSGKVARSSVSADNTTKGYALAPDNKTWMRGDKWRVCGTAIYVSTDKLTLYADDKSNFNYFNIGDDIRLYGKFGSEKYLDRKVASKTEKSLTLDSALSIDPKSPIMYHGLRMSVDFNTIPEYDGICKKRAWAKTNEISWDGVSNYNKC